MFKGDSHELNNSHETGVRSGGHNRWVAMQSAYAEYQRTSEALEYLPLSGDSSNDERLLRAALQDRQRVAFERYLDARMEFLEYRFDESERRRGRGLSLVRKRSPGAFGIASWLAFSNERAVLPVLAGVMLLCAAGLYFARQQNRARELEAARDELWATLNQTRDEARRLSLSTNRQVDYARPETARRTPRPPARKVQRAAQKNVSAIVEPLAGVQVQRIGARTYYSFSLEPLRQFKRVGPVQVLLRSADAQRSYVNLSLMSGPVKLEAQRLRLGQPLWIGDGQRQQPLELIVDRIGGNRIYGRVVETREKSDLRASRTKAGLSANP
jgi:hypothetical protein